MKNNDYNNKEKKYSLNSPVVLNEGVAHVAPGIKNTPMSFIVSLFRSLLGVKETK